MKKFVLFTVLSSVLLLASCQTDSEKADKLRLENKFEEAAELYLRAANAGDAYAKWRLSEAYANGDGVDYDEEKALELLTEASNDGCEEATCDLALAYILGRYELEEDQKRGKTMLDKLVSNTGNAYVQSQYAARLFMGLVPYEEEKEKAIEILSKVENTEEPTYLFVMGIVYITGTDKLDIDVNKAVDYLIKAYQNGKKNCSWMLADLFSEGYGDLGKDVTKQIEWLNRGIEGNITKCMTSMAKLCLSEDSIYQVVHNPQRGLELLKKASKRRDGEANYQLGHLYYIGKYVPKDDKKCFEYYQEAAKLHSGAGAFSLGLAYIEGTGCSKDIEKGIETWKLAVDCGSGAAANNLFCYYGYGYYVNKKEVINNEMAKMYLLKAAELGDVWGCFNLGKEYYWGNNLMDKNDSQAFVYIKKAADAGNVDACAWLSEFYAKGIGSEKDPQKAKEYRDKTIVKDDKN